MDKINNIRKEIDSIDTKIMELLDERFAKTSHIGTLKKQTTINVYDKNREEAIFNKMANYRHYPELKNIYTTIMNESKKLQRKK
ncbi:hypothetical protein KQ51_00402 [Candidatus Izimaplasma bacterium HR1]|jgi:monofunctional chorismate mutase|uniref:chorismate mutase n=1 Tax=Candidatus Izimoplasma sp. HR1 TaxID=1541959 RepID=UPI0004F8CEB4|nr:hypothetical protein KQ51_00402 [Candidatus Izimaplasma bacterium HR1]